MPRPEWFVKQVWAWIDSRVSVCVWRLGGGGGGNLPNFNRRGVQISIRAWRKNLEIITPGGTSIRGFKSILLVITCIHTSYYFSPRCKCNGHWYSRSRSICWTGVTRTCKMCWMQRKLHLVTGEKWLLIE